MDLFNAGLPQISNLFKKKKRTVSAKNNKTKCNKKRDARTVNNLDP